MGCSCSSTKRILLRDVKPKLATRPNWELWNPQWDGVSFDEDGFITSFNVSGFGLSIQVETIGMGIIGKRLQMLDLSSNVNVRGLQRSSAHLTASITVLTTRLRAPP